MRRPLSTISSAVATALVLGLAAPATVPAATAPAASTGSATSVTRTSAALRGYVNPRKRPTTYIFQYGTSAGYGIETRRHSAGNGSSTVKFTETITQLAPGTTYHYRMVASSDAGTTNGADRTFTTDEVAPAVTLRASPAAPVFGTGTFLTGRLTGSRIANRAVILQQRVFPFKSSFQTVGTPKPTDASGAFGFGIAPVLTATQYRVATADTPRGRSPTVTVQVAVRVRTNVSSRLVTAHRRVLFSGTVRPAHDGAQFAIQRRRAGLWTTVAGGVTTHNDGASSQFAIRVPVARTAFYRVYVRVGGGGFVSGVGRLVHIRIR